MAIPKVLYLEYGDDPVFAAGGQHEVHRLD